MSEMRDVVLEIVQREGLIPSAHVYQAQRADVTALGRTLSRALPARVGERAWANGLSATGRKSIGSDAIRILGFGASLTSFLTAGIAMDTNQRAKVMELGALANLIVSLYDEFVDRGYSAEYPAEVRTRPCDGCARQIAAAHDFLAAIRARAPVGGAGVRLLRKPRKSGLRKTTA